MDGIRISSNICIIHHLNVIRNADKDVDHFINVNSENVKCSYNCPAILQRTCFAPRGKQAAVSK